MAAGTVSPAMLDAKVCLRVLAVEGSSEQADRTQRTLDDERLAAQARSSFTVVHATDLAGALVELGGGGHFDVVLLDLSLPDSRGLATLEAIRAVTALPVVVLSAADEHVGYEAVERGAQDFVLTDAASLPTLPRAIRYAVRRARLRAELAAALDAREQADERLRTFVSMASHELRSPLASIQGLAGLLVNQWDALDDDQRRDFAHRIDRRIGHASAVATLYLNAAADGEEIHAVPSDVSLSILCQDAASTVPTPPDVVDVKPGSTTFDASHLVAILVNLLTNAGKYGASPVRLTGDATQLIVSDRGPGVPSEDVEALFAPWSRRARDGVHSTGLGLALAAQLARANGGELAYERVDGETRFILDLPQRGSEAD